LINGEQILVGTTIRNTLNRVALSAATYVATAGEGQKPTYVVEDFGTYWKNIGDAAAGDFIDGLGKNWGVDLCQPPDANVQAKISLGLVQTLAPEAPDCTLSNLVNNYSSAYEKYAAMESGDYLKGIQVSLEPGGGELGSAFTLFGRTFEASTKATENEKTSNTITQGWLDVRNIAGKLTGVPGAAKDDVSNAKKLQTDNLLKTTGNALVDASNTFLNQLAYEGFQRVLREVSKGKSSSVALDTAKLASSGFESLIQYGTSVVSEKLASVIKPHFDVRSDYSILSDLATCSDNNNPGPNNCVIDDKFSQAISEKLTVGDALEKGYLHGDWLVSGDSKSNSTYTLRNVNILRKYRIVPVGWEQAISTAISKGYRVTLQDLVSCFDGKGQFSNDFDQKNQAWCRGLVDPNWVLKAPLNYCAKQGVGSQITSSLISKDIDGTDALSISRATDYCADNQTCIKEKIDGSCEVYGYCNEEKRTWKFGTDSCEPVYNTCQTFTSSDKQTVSFLENTLDYSTCDANNSGCKQYSLNGTYASSTNTINWDKNAAIFFNNKAVSCDASNESCTQLLRGKPGWGDVNYIMDTDFSLNNVGDTGSTISTSWHWPVTDTGKIVDDGGKALSVSGASQAVLSSNNTASLLPKNLAPITGWSYTLSADVKLVSGDKITMKLGDDGDQTETTSNTWTTISVTAQNTNNLNFSITTSGTNANFVVRNLKLTPNNYYPGYSSYGAFSVNEKLLPNYLETTCYNSTSGTGDYTLKDDAPAVCNNFARKCNRNEVGCELFTSVKDIFKVAAKANINDYCDASCVGYDTYLAKASYFYGTSADNLIPDNAKSCGAESVGCSSFTNLDAVNQGGENVEYYSKVRQCIKPDTTSCSDFYSWDNAQLKVMSLKKDSSGDPFVINSVSDAACTKEIYNLPVTDPRYNSDCREFYNKGGKITYHLMSNTVSCSDNCHSYRLNEKNIDKTATDKDTCSGTWDDSQSACYVCQNGGVWDTKQNACIYKVIPNEGTTCSAAEVGCREYNGNNGNNLKLVASYDFESDVNGFYSLGGGAVSQSSESTVKNGHSLNVTNDVGVGVSGFVKKDSAYIVKFMAKASGAAVTANLSFENSSNDISTFGISDNNPTGNLTIKGDNQWHLYEINLAKLDHEPAGESLKIKVDKALVIDNLIITEITDRYYLIKGSSQVPDICSYDMSDKYQGPNYNLGCSSYTDRAGTTHNLHQFSELCQNSAVGCEQMIQTNNSSRRYGYTVNLNSSDKNTACVAGTSGCLEVPDSQAIYAVFDSSKQCNSADAGCSRFGYLKTTGGSTSWMDVFKKNLPDAYSSDASSPLCRANEVGCDTWTYGNGSASYFKTPGLNTCVYKNNNWYKSPVKRCDINGDSKITDSEKVGAVCVANTDCGTKKCITDTNDYPCNISYLKTMGLGGVNGRVATPDGSVGLCSAEAAGCSEYIDPLSKYVNNLISNPSAEKIDNIVADKWGLSGGFYVQRIGVKPNKLYVLELSGNVSEPITVGNFATTENGTGGSVRILGEDNKLGDPVTSLVSSSSVMFNTGANTYLSVYRKNITKDSSSLDTTVIVKEAIINYQLSSNVDTTSCNGTINTDNGCVLFNARTQSGSSGLKSNIFNAILTSEGSAPISCNTTDPNCLNNANTVIKVTPDRICSRWLSCQTSSEDPVTHEKTCYKVGECDQLNDKNECGNLLPMDNKVRDISNNQNKNATGYSLLNNYYIGAMKEVGQNTDALYDFENKSDTLTCRRDVGVSASNAALYAQRNNACTAEPLILSPDKDKNKTDYPAHGKGYVAVLNSTQVSPGNEITIYTNQDYYINYLVNTKGSGAQAKLLITDSPSSGTPTVKASFVDTANNGWVRKVYKFNVLDPNKKNTQAKIKVYLTSDTNSLAPGYVYFDDINIEPVLQTGPNSYVSKDCRLYPGEDSLSCLSANNNVIKDGLYGYCLQYDQINPNVCLMWYPIDRISSLSQSSQLNLGYVGKFPLNYCTEANGDFDVVEKRNGVLNIWADSEINSSLGKTSGDWTDDWNWIKNKLGANLDSTVSCSGAGITANNCSCVDDTQSAKVCGSPDYTAVYNTARIDNGVPDLVALVYCVPKQSSLLVKSGQKTVNFKNYKTEFGCNFTFNEGWGVYNGFLNRPLNMAVNSGSGADISFDISNLSDIDEANNNESTKFDSLMVLDNGRSTEADLKFVSNQNDQSEVYRFACNKFTQLVDSVGKDMAWTGRIGQSSTITPNFFSSSLLLYGHDVEDVPFGSANLPNGYDLNNSTDLLVLRNQYSTKNNETTFAGRPYGCTGKNCDKIGQCNTDPKVYCIYYEGDTELNKKSCTGGGVCQKLWTSVPTSADALKNLNQIFAFRYGDYKYVGGAYVKDTSLKQYDEPSICSSASARDNKVICANLPVVKNESLKTSAGVLMPITGGNTTIQYGGLYQLEFDVYVDSEQQPLKQVVVYWGKDDGYQIITNFDNAVREDSSGNKYYHVSLSRYYLRGDKHLEIKAYDNWNKWKCSAMVGSSWNRDADVCKNI